MQPFPNTLAIFVRAGKIVKPWTQYLQQFTQAPPAFVTVIVGTTPFSYIAKEPGFVYVNGGTVTTIFLLRGSENLNMTGQLVIPVSINDTVTIDYSVLPTVKFIPIYGANTQ